MRRINLTAIFALILIGTSSLFSQVDKGDEVQMILTQFKNWRYGSVNVYEVLDPSEIKEIMDSRKAAAGGVNTDDIEAIMNKYPADIIKDIENGVSDELTPDEIQNNMIMQGKTPPAMEDMKIIYQYKLTQILGGIDETILHVYIITTIPERLGELPSEIIGAILVENEFDLDDEKLKANLKNVAAGDVYSNRRLRNDDIDEGTYGYKTLYDLMYSYFVQGNVENKSMEAKGIGDSRFFTQEFGVSKPLIDYGRYTGKLRSQDIQKFIRISNQEPLDYRGNNQVVLLSPDKISWTKYSKPIERKRNGQPKLDSLGREIIDMRRPTNSDLPEFGVEVAYGAEDVNFPTFWSERLTASAFWRNVKFGLILPTSGWSMLSEEVFNQERSMTHGSFGVSGQLDFPIAVIQKSEVFHMSFGHVFGDANPAAYREGDSIRSNVDLFEQDVNNIPASFQQEFAGEGNTYGDYLLRTNATMLYTFAMSIDESYLLRFGIGGSFYNVERWNYIADSRLGNEGNIEYTEYGHKKLNSESIGGVNLRVDFIAQNPRTPFGARINFFDQVMYLDAFVQIPVINNSFSLKLNAKGNIVTRSFTRPWEPTRGFFQPNLSLIYAF